MYAKVIVDVPANQTDKLFDYLVPEELERFISPGMRVVVPFGSRKIQGFVWEITTFTSLQKVKPITELLDPFPVLTPEMMKLAEYLANETVCFLITALQSMIPAAIRAKPKKMLTLTANKAELPPVLQAVFGKQHTLEWKDLPHEKGVLQLVKQASENGDIDIDYVVSDKTNKKIVQTVSIHPDYRGEDVQNIVGNKAKKQAAVLQWLQENAGSAAIAVKQLTKELHTTRQTVLELVRKNLLVLEEREEYRDPYQSRVFQEQERPALTTQQQHVLQPVQQAVHDKEHMTFLLRGVTGSGKTEVYLQAIEKVLAKGEEAIVLVPEISLTPQMVERFKARFGSKVAVLHSALAAGEKYDEWRKIHRKEVQVAVGARSAVFAPFEHLGLIIIDEEHEGSYKQEDHPKYHARQVAIWRGKHHNCPVMLGSATPSLESYARARKGVYKLLELKERVNNIAMPVVNIIDMREELKKGNRSVFSELLLEKLRTRIERNEQAVLFLNRRGYSTFVMCRNCGYTADCPHCEITLTYHHTKRQLKCHYCGFEEPMLQRCPDCDSEHIRFFGTGTQKVEEELTKLLPEARVIRMDVDTTKRKGSHEKLLQSFGRGEADILLGTQMIAKGLDFPKITLAGVLAADTLLHLPDFRASERTFQLLTQVSGRAGRDKLTGEVVIQTYTPDHYSIQHAKTHNYEAFTLEEMGHRKRSGYPPYYYLALLTIASEDVVQVIQTSEKIAAYLRQSLSSETKVLGPTVSPIARIKDRYRYQCMIKYRNEPNLTQTLQVVASHYQKEIASEKMFISIDMNPQMFM
ncbi:replication restart DNA helicase PriA [Alteribacillus persepolensis]|uniref:Replication restart protein PriA n=1 Tax=Alteribacillus persepolensis TaxID=568899 RepID=A0A1G7YI73_9BACI|nr:primosomal protein N' [Alteribacillus persepolensis]SDG96268.1 replication restart DNA helicase PriA [Alteribacillus persepolensis]